MEIERDEFEDSNEESYFNLGSSDEEWQGSSEEEVSNDETLSESDEASGLEEDEDSRSESEEFSIKQLKRSGSTPQYQEYQSPPLEAFNILERPSSRVQENIKESEHKSERDLSKPIYSSSTTLHHPWREGSMSW